MAVQKQIVPDDGEASKREQQHGMQEVRRQKKGWCRHSVGTSMITKHGVYIKMSRREKVKRYGDAVKWTVERVE